MIYRNKFNRNFCRYCSTCCADKVCIRKLISHNMVWNGSRTAKDGSSCSVYIAAFFIHSPDRLHSDLEYSFSRKKWKKTDKLPITYRMMQSISVDSSHDAIYQCGLITWCNLSLWTHRMMQSISVDSSHDAINQCGLIAWCNLSVWTQHN